MEKDRDKKGMRKNGKVLVLEGKVAETDSIIVWMMRMVERRIIEQRDERGRGGKVKSG